MKKIVLYSLLFFLFLFVERQVSSYIAVPYNFLFRFAVTYAFVLGFCLVRKPTGRQLFLIFLFGFTLPDIALRLIDGMTDAMRTLPDQVLEIVPAVCAYYWCKSRRILPTIVASGLLVIALVFFSAKWMQYASYGNFTGAVHMPVSGWKVYDKQSDTLQARDYGNKVIVFDVWNTGCVSCFNRFPILQGLYEKYRNDPRVSIQALNIPLERDTAGMAFSVVEKKHFTFPVVVSANGLDSLFHIDAYPLVLVLHNDEIVFRGKIEEVETAIATTIVRN